MLRNAKKRFDGQLLFIHGLEIKEVTTKTEHSVSSRYAHFYMNKSDGGGGGCQKNAEPEAEI